MSEGSPDSGARISIVFLGNELLTARSATQETHIDEFNDIHTPRHW